MGIVQCLFNLLYYVIGVRNTKKPPKEGAWAIVKSTNGVKGYPKTKQLNFWLKLNGRNEKNARNTLLDVCYLLYEEYLKPWPSKNLKIFRMNNKTIIEFGFRMM